VAGTADSRTIKLFAEARLSVLSDTKQLHPCTSHAVQARASDATEAIAAVFLQYADTGKISALQARVEGTTPAKATAQSAKSEPTNDLIEFWNGRAIKEG